MSDIRFNQWLHQSGTGGVTQLSSGHVGIGTTSPLIPVHSGNNAVLNVGVVTANNIYAGTLNGTLALSDISGITGSFTSDVSINGNLDIADKIRHIGDTNTAIRFPAADKITLETSGTERFQVDSSGNVYVGGVGASATAGVLWFNDTSANASKISQDNGNSALVFGTGSGQAERLRIGSSGQIGLSGANYGTAGQVLTSQGSGSAVQWATPASNYKITTGSVINTGNSTNETITGIPSDAVKVELVYYNLKTTASGVMAMRAGNASNIDNQSWFSAHTYVVNTNQSNGDVKTAQWSSRFQMPHQDFTSSANRRTGIFTFTKHIGGTNIWYCVNDMVYSENGTNAIPRNFINKGYIDMGASGFDRIKIFTYDNEVNIDYNGKIQLKYYQVV